MILRNFHFYKSDEQVMKGFLEKGHKFFGEIAH